MAAVALLVNVVFNMVFIFPLHHIGLALATSLASYCNGLWLLRVLLRDGLYQPQPGWFLFIARLFVANVVLAITALWSAGVLAQWTIWNTWMRSAHLMGVIVLSVSVYTVVLWVTGVRFNDLKWVGGE